METAKKEALLLSVLSNSTEGVSSDQVRELKRLYDKTVDQTKKQNVELTAKIDNIEKEAKQRNVSQKRLGILTIHTPPYYKTWANWTISNHKKYAKRHNYGMYIENGKSDPREPVWSKITALLRHMEDDRHDWFWALDLGNPNANL
jgi:galactosyl transferase GMA12/MNN10 family